MDEVLKAISTLDGRYTLPNPIALSDLLDPPLFA